MPRCHKAMKDAVNGVHARLTDLISGSKDLLRQQNAMEGNFQAERLLCARAPKVIHFEHIRIPVRD
jgi:hypothetical protein